MRQPAHPSTEEVETSQDVADWYWTRAELNTIARRFGVPRSGNKQELTARIIAWLNGTEIPKVKPARATSPALTGPITRETLIPPGQRMTSALRAWAVRQAGPAFRFDEHMRRFLREADGKTFGDLVDYWYLSRTFDRPAIGSQFEYNAFTRDFRDRNPEAERGELLAAWQEYKATPVSQRDT